MTHRNVDNAPEQKKTSKSMLFLGLGLLIVALITAGMVTGFVGTALVIMSVADPIKETTPQAIRALHALGLKVAMITGDARQVAG